VRTIKLTLQYDGTRYAGFQRQPNGLTVQEALEDALRSVTGVPDLKIGAAAGRTDAGVHARGQVVHFRTDSRIPADRWPYALNQKLPADIVAFHAEEVPTNFHARYWAVSKRYRYTIEWGPFQSPMSRLYAHHWPKDLNVEQMGGAARLIEGRHDFAAFRSTGGAAKTSVRTVQHLEVTHAAPFVYVDVAADGFLYNMVRIIAGTLLEVGAGRRSLDEVRLALETGRREYAGKTLAAHGLCLEAVTYGDGPTKPPHAQPLGDEDDGD
jgi:tRNA pseudouridine38-40 synthase